ncbi:hypothetical protein KIPB_005076 [Kipferlia bialata]|uniref:Uncharacterized protein n=1 Tax=Kipferlia bialata TaxID=797122 RepID=A0A9K3GGF0_9EUKA|nr:hypothetical protein KIPB_003029 [Kipferlia bialata]GIQ83718.1 hypothetical protein KIPB_005076 [Kipferlia bialata]|eukprot:g3029.t1
MVNPLSVSVVYDRSPPFYWPGEEVTGNVLLTNSSSEPISVTRASLKYQSQNRCYQPGSSHHTAQSFIHTYQSDYITVVAKGDEAMAIEPNVTQEVPFSFELMSDSPPSVFGSGPDRPGPYMVAINQLVHSIGVRANVKGCLTRVKYDSPLYVLPSPQGQHSGPVAETGESRLRCCLGARIAMLVLSVEEELHNPQDELVVGCGLTNMSRRPIPSLSWSVVRHVTTPFSSWSETLTSGSTEVDSQPETEWSGELRIPLLSDGDVYSALNTRAFHGTPNEALVDTLYPVERMFLSHPGLSGAGAGGIEVHHSVEVKTDGVRLPASASLPICFSLPCCLDAGALMESGEVPQPYRCSMGSSVEGDAAVLYPAPPVPVLGVEASTERVKGRVETGPPDVAAGLGTV